MFKNCADSLKRVILGKLKTIFMKVYSGIP